MFSGSKVAITAAWCLLLLAAIPGVGQSVAPPIAEYRGKADGMYELKNDGDAAMAVILEVHGFSVDENGNLGYAPLDPKMKVELKESSFVIPPHESHYVFYKAEAERPTAWFTILSSMTRAVPVRNQMRINFVLPHVVYLYQKKKLKKEDVAVRLLKGDNEGEYLVEVENHTDKLGRVEGVSTQGFEKKSENGGFPVFPNYTRRLMLRLGEASGKGSVTVSFEDGFSITTSL